MDEVTRPELNAETRVILRPAVALIVGVVVGIGVGIAVAAALTSVAQEYGEDATAKHAAPLGSVVVEDEPDEPDQIVIVED